MELEPTLLLSPLSLCIVGVASLIIGYKTYASYTYTRNPLGLVSTYLCSFLGVALLMLGLPFLLTRNETVLLWADYVAVVALTGAFLALSRLLWFALLKDKLRFAYVAVPVFACGVAVLISDITTIQIVEKSGALTYQSSQLSLALKSLLYIFVALPLGIFYGYQAYRQPGRGTKLKLGTLAALLILASISGVLENVTSSGQATDESGAARIVLALLVLVYALWPRRRAKALGPNLGQQPQLPSLHPVADAYTAAPSDKTSSPPPAHSKIQP